MRSVVVFPHPDGPSRLKNSPSAMSRDRSSTAGTSPKNLETRSSRTSISVTATSSKDPLGLVDRSTGRRRSSHDHAGLEQPSTGTFPRPLVPVGQRGGSHGAAGGRPLVASGGPSGAGSRGRPGSGATLGPITGSYRFDPLSAGTSCSPLRRRASRGNAVAENS